MLDASLACPLGGALATRARPAEPTTARRLAVKTAARRVARSITDSVPLVGPPNAGQPMLVVYLLRHAVASHAHAHPAAPPAIPDARGPAFLKSGMYCK